MLRQAPGDILYGGSRRIAMARRKRRSHETKAPAGAPAAIAASALLVALCGLVAALFVRSNLTRHAATSAGLGAGGALVLVGALGSLAFFVFVLAGWQWRLSPRARHRILVAAYLSLFVAFCGLCWHDVGVAMARLPGAGPALRQLAERSAAVLVTLGALAFGLVAVVVVVGTERRRPGRQQ